MVALMIAFFLSVGAFFGTIIKDKSTKIFAFAVLFIASILIVPLIATKVNRIIANDVESLDTFEHEKLKLFMGIERRLFNKYGKFEYDDNTDPETIDKIIEDVLGNEFKEIMNREEDKRKQILKKIKINQTFMEIFPTTFYSLTNRELSSCGELGFIDFHSFSQSTKNNFRMFIIKKKFFERAKPGKVEPFTIKDNDKNVFYAKSHLPFNFWLGVFLTPFYTVLLLFFSIRILKKRFKIPEAKTAYTIEQEKGNPLFVLCKNETIKEDIFNFYQRQGACCLEKINTGDFMFNGVKAQEIFKHLCQVSGIDEKKALENLNQMGIKDLRGLPVCHEIILKIYAAVTTAADSESIVMNDFLKNESRELEKDFLRLLLFLEKAGKKIIYLSCQMWNTSTPFEETIKFPTSVVNGFKAFPMDVNNMSVR
jgi:hypothetical protein